MKEFKFQKRKTTLLFTTAVALLAVLSLGVSTYAWFQANADVHITAEGDTAEITVAAPESVKFYYFKGNGTPGNLSSYTGYSKAGAAFGNATNVIGTTENGHAGAFSTNGDSNTPTYTSMATFANAWGLIDLTSNSTASGVASPKNCFNFSKMRPGCYYSFCVETNLATSTVKLLYDWSTSESNGVTGDSFAQKRYLQGQTNYPINLLMAIHGYCKEINSNDGTAYINNTVGISDSYSLTEKIAFTPISTAVTDENRHQEFTMLNAATTSTNKYIYFTIYMGKQNKSDAYRYMSTDGSIDYYQAGNTGTYSVFDGLKSTLINITVS